MAFGSGAAGCRGAERCDGTDGFVVPVGEVGARLPAVSGVRGPEQRPVLAYEPRIVLALGLHQSHRIGVRYLVHFQPDAVNVLDPGFGFLHGPVEVGDAQRLAEARTVG